MVAQSDEQAAEIWSCASVFAREMPRSGSYRHLALQGPPSKAWKIIGKASALGEEVYIIAGAYYDAQGRIPAGPGTYMFNASGGAARRHFL